MKNRLANMNKINIGYVVFWGIVSFISSFVDIMNGNFEKLYKVDLLFTTTLPILVIWVIAFLVDYIFVFYTYDKKERILDEHWVKAFYVLICILFIILFFTLHVHKNEGMVVCIILWYLCMIGLKWCSLNISCPRERVEKV